MGNPSLDMSQNPKHDLGQVLCLILRQQKCLLNCIPGVVQMNPGLSLPRVKAGVFGRAIPTLGEWREREGPPVFRCRVMIAKLEPARLLLLLQHFLFPRSQIEAQHGITR